MDQNICSSLCKQTGCLHRTHIVIRIDTAHKLIFTLDRYNWEIVGGELSGRYVIDAKSIMGIFSTDLSKPVNVRVYAEGAEAEKALQIIRKYAEE